jgi:hypothetical protein
MRRREEAAARAEKSRAAQDRMTEEARAAALEAEANRAEARADAIEGEDH